MKNISRKKFYSVFVLFLVILIFAVIGVLPGVEGLGGLILLYNVVLPLFVISLIILIIYEFFHLPLPENVNYSSLKKTSLILMIVHFVIILVMGYLTQQDLFLSYDYWQSEGVSVFLLLFLSLSVYIVLFLLASLNFYLARQNRFSARKWIILNIVFGVLAIIYSSLSLPDKIYFLDKDRVATQDRMIYEESLAKNDLELCLTVGDNHNCIEDFALKNSDFQLCLRLPVGHYRRNQCFLTIVEKTKNKEACDLLAEDTLDSKIKEDCLERVTRAIYNAEYVGFKDSEITEAATEENNIDICLAIEHSDRNYNFVDCQLAVALQNSANDCEKIDFYGSDAQKKACYSHFGYSFNVYGDDDDGDGIKNSIEKAVWHTDPNKADTDGDGYNDRQEIIIGYDPLVK